MVDNVLAVVRLRDDDAGNIAHAGVMAAVPIALLFLPSRLLAIQFPNITTPGRVKRQFSQMLENNLGGIVDVKSFTAEEQEIRRFSQCGEELAEAYTEAAAVSALESAMGRAIYSTGFAMTAAYGGQFVSQGKLRAG